VGPIFLYLSHPLRVARLVLDLHPAPTPDLGVIGVLHNVFEVCAKDERDLVDAGFSSEVASAIRLLTIDRQRETDPGYLADFYGAIEAHSEGLALVRCADKLDNLLGLELLEEGPIRDSYIDLAERFVGPIASRLSPAFGAFFQAVVAHMRKTGCSAPLKQRYDRFITEHSSNASEETRP
jgi:(p)ppGpp synthase/HD superfamily hydrolase